MTESRESALHVGIHGRYPPHPWLADDTTTDADAFSLVTEAAEVRGLSSSSTGGPDFHAPVWGHNDAGQISEPTAWTDRWGGSRSHPCRGSRVGFQCFRPWSFHSRPCTASATNTSQGSIWLPTLRKAGIPRSRQPSGSRLWRLVRSASSVMDNAQLAPIEVAAQTECSGWWRVVEDPADPSPARAVEFWGLWPTGVNGRAGR